MYGIAGYIAPEDIFLSAISVLIHYLIIESNAPPAMACPPHDCMRKYGYSPAAHPCREGKQAKASPLQPGFLIKHFKL
ncbi:hypothetical protein [Bacteroides gallinarum]|uniref:hypothetical protein n=1 Tax=Bacteroides gallinarum TaxID=376806 RepID=UPI0003671AE3|nr:hypothetical protein [Bacteroides gallinarum]